MRFAVFNTLGFITLVLAATYSNAQSLTGGIPVYCYNCQVAVQNAAISTNEQIKAQTKAIEQGLEFFLRSLQYGAGNLEAIRRDTDAMEREERMLGDRSLPINSCGQYAATTSRAQSSAARKASAANLGRSSRAHSGQSRDLPDGEPRTAYSIQRVNAELDDQDIQYAEKVMGDDAIAQAEAEGIKRIQNLIAVPFPVVTPSEAEVQRIKASGTPAEREQLAASIALQRRQELALFVLDSMFSDRLAILDPAGLSEMLPIEMRESSEPISDLQMREALMTWRVRDPAWFEDLASSEDTVSMVRDQSMMQAEMLNSMWEQTQYMRELLRLAAYDSVRDTSQSGPQLR